MCKYRQLPGLHKVHRVAVELCRYMYRDWHQDHDLPQREVTPHIYVYDSIMFHGNCQQRHDKSLQKHLVERRIW